MRIARVTAWRQWQPFTDGACTCSGGRVAEGFDALIVRLASDEGVEGIGEFAPLGSLAIAIEISRMGGVQRARRLRDRAVDMDLGVTIEDSGGADIDTAATAHLMLSTPESLQLHTVDFMNRVTTVSSARGMQTTVDGAIGAPQTPGVGLELEVQILGEPLLDLRA